MPDYGLNFGYRRSGGDSAVREGRFRVPKNAELAAAMRQGSLVTVDPDEPGYLKLAPSGSKIVPGFCGLLIQHDGPTQSYFDAPERDSHALGGVKAGNLAVIQAGAGEKIWLKNTPKKTLFGGREIAARTVITATGLVIGDELTWDGTKFIKKAGSVASVAKVTATNGTDYAEAILLIV